MMKKYAFLFGCCLFLLVGMSCIRPLSTTLVRDAYIGSAFAFRINDAIGLAYPEMELDTAVELQELVEGHPRLNQIIHNYLCAYGAYMQRDTTAFEHMDNEKTFQRINRDILAETRKRNPNATMVVSEEEFLGYVEKAEAEVESILQNRIPQNLKNYGNLGVTAIVLYGLVTSVWMQMGLLMIMILLLIAMYKRMLVCSMPEKEGTDELSNRKGAATIFYKNIGKLFLFQGIFWAVLLPVCIKIGESRLLGIVDRILGRSMFLEVAPFLWRGGILVGISVILFLTQILLKSNVFHNRKL